MTEGARVVQRAAAEPRAVAAPRPAVRSAPRVQRATLRLSQPHDPSEREAEQVARQVVTMKLPVLPPRERVGLLAARAPAAPPPPRAAPQDEVSPELTAEIKAEQGAGQPLPADTRSFLEPRFKANFAGVRIHADGRAASIAARLGASAFTFGRDIFFANGRYNPDSAEGTELLAHELTHTIQQREVVQRELAPAAAAAGVLVTQRTAPKVQRGIVSRALDWIADKANNIPGYRMLTIVIGRNPINMAKVDRSGENILRALIEFIPGGHLIVEALENHGVMQKGGKFIEEQFAALGDLGGALKDALMEFIDSLGWSDIFHLGDLWDRAKRIFTTPVDKAIAFGKNLVSGIATLVKEAVIKPLGRWAANNIPKWNLLVGVFGKNPISDEQESPGYALIGAFMELIGQQEIWENIKKGGAIGRAWNWFQKALKGALSLVTSIPGRVMSTLRSLTIFDIVTLVGAFRKVVGAFASFVGDFFRWAGSTVLDLLEIIFSVVAPSVVPYLKKAGSAFSTIIKAPGRFIGTLVAAGKQGFNQFKINIVKHLRDALFKWLLGSAEGAGIYFPKSFAPLELLKLGLSVLGLTWANVRAKLIVATNKTTVEALETGFALVKTLISQGPAAAWEELLKTLSNLKSMVVDAAIDFVKGEIVRIAIEKLVSFLTPAGAFIQAVIAIYRTISFIVSKLAEIGRLVAAFIDGIAALANGIVGAAANKVESVLATGLSLAISFLANFAGLGNVPKKVMLIIKKIRDPVDKALDKVVAWIIAQARKLGRFVAQAGVPHDPNERLGLALATGTRAVNALSGRTVTSAAITPVLAGIRVRYGLTSIVPVAEQGVWWLEAAINPRRRERSDKATGSATSTGAGSWRLAPDGLRSQEGKVLTSDKGVHLYQVHGGDVVVLSLEEETNRYIQAFQTGRANLIAFYQAQVASISEAMSNVSARPRASDNRLLQMTENLAGAQSLLNFWRGLNPNDREAAAAAMQHGSWRSRAANGPRQSTELRKTRFRDDHTLERAITQVLNKIETQSEIDRRLTAAPRVPVRITSFIGGNLGVGFEMGPQQRAVRIKVPLSHVTIVVRALDEQRRVYVVETGWPHP